MTDCEAEHHSLALLGDAGHMLTDAGALAASLFAVRLARRPASGVWTFGFRRAEILSAQANGITLLVVSALVAFEAIGRLIHPLAVTGSMVLVRRPADCHQVRRELEQLLCEHLGLDHATLQVDHAPDDVLAIGDGTN